MKKIISTLWLATSVFVLPCILNPEKAGVCAFIIANLILSYLYARKHNPSMFL